MAALSVNGTTHQVDVDPETPLLWVLRETIGLTGTKYGCGIAQCGACTVHVDGVATRSCSMPVSAAERQADHHHRGARAERALHKVQQAWLDHDVPQCGYCQSGMIMAAAALLKEKPKPTDADIDAAITNICRCGTYPAGARGDPRRGDRREGEAAESHAGNRSPLVPRRHRRRRRRARADFALAGRRPSRARPSGTPKSTPGSSSSPDDTVVIRIARSEMGQGC